MANKCNKIIRLKSIYGDRTYPNDVYVLEKQDTSTGSIVRTKVATIMPIRIATTTTSQVTYKVVYYGNNTNSIENLGNLSDSIPSEPEISTDKSTIILGALENANYYDDVWYKSNIRISDTSTAMFYDDDFNGTGYIEYNGAIYKITYTGTPRDRDGRINNVELTNIDINTLSVSDHNFNTIVSRNATYNETREENGTIYYLYFDEQGECDYWYNSAGVLIDVSDHFNTNW